MQAQFPEARSKRDRTSSVDAYAPTWPHSTPRLAQTPQAFPFARLRLALRAALARGDAVTDEASAIELDGGRPLLVPGAHENLKVTEAADLALAAFWLGRRAAEGAA